MTNYKNLLKIKNPFSFATFLALITLVFITRLVTPTWLQVNCLAPISWDVFGYYLYLPASFIHHDTGIHNFAWLQQVLDTYQPTIDFYQAYKGPTGDYVMKYPIGLAILFSPFFFLAHLLAPSLGYPADGFSLPYQVGIAFGAVVYTVTGLWFFRKVMLRFFSDGIVAFIMAVIVLGTNYYHLTAFDNTMPHNFLFTIFAITIWLTIRWHEKPARSTAISLGLLAGLAMLVRPTAGIIVLIPLLWNVWGKESLHAKLRLINYNFSQVLLMVLAMMFVGSFQLIYWKLHAGSWLYYSYEKGESLRWIAPYIRLVLFSYKKGWLLYTPVMAFAIIGFIPLFKNYRNIFLSLFLYFMLHLIIVSSWPTWWYGGSFGQRTMMEAYVILAFPLGAFAAWALRARKGVRFVSFGIIILLVLFSLFQTWQYTHYVLSPSQMTKGYYWATFGKTKVAPRDLRLLEPSNNPDEREFLPQSDRFTARVLAEYRFEQPDPANAGLYCRDTASSGIYSYRINTANQFSPGISIPYQDLAKGDFAWIQACGSIYFTCDPKELKCALVITCNQNGEAYKYKMIRFDKQNFKPGIWNRVCMDYMTPDLAHKEEPVQVYFWNFGEHQVLVDDIEIKVFEFEE